MSRPTALASTVPSQMDVRLTERDLSKVLAELSKPIAAEPQSAFMLVQPLAPSAARASTLDFESPPLTLAPSLEPGKAERDDSRPRLGAMALGGGAVGRALGGGSAPNISFSEFTGGMRWPTFNYQAVFLPHWLVLGAVSLPAVFAMAGVLRRGLLWFRRKRSGLCVACGYDLRAAVGGRCPECGKIGSGQFVGEMSPPPQSPAADVR